MNQRAMLQRAATLIQAGNVAEGVTLCREILAATPRHADALHLLALAARDMGDPLGAEARFRESLSSARQPGVLVDFANFLRGQGRLADAEALLRNAIELAADFAPAWRSLGVLLRGDNRLEEALHCAHRATTLAPRHPAGWELAAAVEQRRDNLDAAIAACREGLRISPAAARLHYSLGQLLRQDCDFPAAARAYEAASSHGYETPELYQNHGDALYEAGNVDAALKALNAGVARYPTSALLQRLRARFHWEVGARGDALAPLWQAARKNPREPALWQTLVELLNRLDRTDEGRAALDEARANNCPQTPDLLLLEAIGYAKGGDSIEATRLFAKLADAQPLHADIKLAFAEHLLTTGDPAHAEALCAAILQTNPLDQLAWAYRGTAWQLLGDTREAWLLDYERMVMPVRVPPPADYSSDAFFGDVRNVLETLHRMQAHPLEQTVRGGTQTNGFLFRLKDPLLRQLSAQVRAAVRTALSGFPRDDAHPFWARGPAHQSADAFSFAGSWSVRLNSQGFHTNHIHPEGWISSALYVALPNEMSDRADHAGHLQFGVPPVETGLALPPRRTVAPNVGEVVLFPSYMWHGTVPFTSEQPRITVAFDIVPGA